MLEAEPETALWYARKVAVTGYWPDWAGSKGVHLNLLLPKALRSASSDFTEEETEVQRGKNQHSSRQWDKWISSELLCGTGHHSPAHFSHPQLTLKGPRELGITLVTC